MGTPQRNRPWRDRCLKRMPQSVENVKIKHQTWFDQRIRQFYQNALYQSDNKRAKYLSTLTTIENAERHKRPDTGWENRQGRPKMDN